MTCSKGKKDRILLRIREWGQSVTEALRLEDNPVQPKTVRLWLKQRVQGRRHPRQRRGKVTEEHFIV